MLKLGENIKKFRLNSELTQEQLADILSVSAQAVSRWENGITYPDITLLPTIASYFEITIDELMGMGDFKSDEQLNELYRQITLNGTNGMIYENIILLREAIKTNPTNYKMHLWLINQLSFCQYKNGSDLTKEELEDNYCEAINIGNIILSRCTDGDIINQTTQELCYLYYRLGEKEKAIEYAKKLPNIWCTNTVILGDLYEGEQQKIHLQWRIKDYLNLFWCDLRNMADLEYKDETMTTSERIAILQKGLAIFEIIFENGDYLHENWTISTTHRYIAAMAMLEHDHGLALSSLQNAADFAIKFDTLIDKTKHTSILVNKLDYDALGQTKNYDFTCCKELYDKMQWDRYNPIREDKRFIAILDKIREYC